MCNLKTSILLQFVEFERSPHNVPGFSLRPTSVLGNSPFQGSGEMLYLECSWIPKLGLHVIDWVNQPIRNWRLPSSMSLEGLSLVVTHFTPCSSIK